MRRRIVRTLSTIAVTVSVLIVTPGYAAAQAQAAGQATNRAVLRRPIPPGALKGTLTFARTELFFGTGKADGSAVTDEEFLAFVDQEITPRFPDGLTLLNGSGQFRGESGVIIKEESWLLILLYPLEGFKDSSQRIDAIRDIYKDTFDQESVLRVDDPFASHVSF